MSNQFKHTPIIPIGILYPQHQGKARDTYAAREPAHLVPVASDRISTHNHVHIGTVPDKGEVLTMLTIFWLTEVLKLPNHLVAWGTKIYDYLPEVLTTRQSYFEDQGLHYRTLIVRKLDMEPWEFILRRYLTGGLLKDYRADRDPYGINLSAGLSEMSRFDPPAFTPTDKSDDDDPVDSNEVKNSSPRSTALAYQAFYQVERYLEERGIALVDTKLEFGCSDNQTFLADELFTPDSSRFVKIDSIQEGITPPWLDKQLVRDYAERTWGDGKKVPLKLPVKILEQTADVYRSLLHTITGRSIIEWRQQLDSV